MLRTARAASLLAAASLFLLQPLVARALVPLYGGTSWIWIAVSVFFQLSLILGYVTAMKLSGPGRARRHARIATLALTFAVAGFWILLRRTTFDGLPVEFAAFLHLALTVGAVAIYLATASPLLQIAIEGDGRIDAHLLYAWSNAGSLAGLILYPAVMESFVPLPYQMAIWLGMAAAAALLIHRTVAFTEASAVTQQTEWRFAGRGRVIYISAVAGALTIAVTTRLTIDLGALPLLWVLPLIVLLLSYVVAFGNLRPRRSLAAAAPLAVAMACYVFFTTTYMAPLALVLLWCGLLFIIQCGLQTQIRALAPSGGARAAFYVALAIGGFTGSLIVGCLIPYYWDTASRLAASPLTAPVLHPLLANDTIPELGWCLAAAAFALVSRERWRARDLMLAAVVGAAATTLIANEGQDLSTLGFSTAALIGAMAIAYLPGAAGRPALFAVGISLIVIASSFVPRDYSQDLVRSRNVYGILTARATLDGGFTQLHHGTTLHGTQYSVINAAGEVLPAEPQIALTYYHSASPIGDVFKALTSVPCSLRVGVIGLGTGTLAAYARPGDEFEFYEIDPGVITIAEGRHFSYLAEARRRGARVTVVQGDGRQTLAKRVGPKLDLVVVDAFSSDSIPAHLLTLEAFHVAQNQLAPSGHMAFHTSNRYFAVARVVAANAARLGWQHSVIMKPPLEIGTSRSQWVIVRPSPAAAPGPCAVNLLRDPGQSNGRDVWTDDFSNPLGLLNAADLWSQLRRARATDTPPPSPPTTNPR